MFSNITASPDPSSPLEFLLYILRTHDKEWFVSEDLKRYTYADIAQILTQYYGLSQPEANFTAEHIYNTISDSWQYFERASKPGGESKSTVTLPHRDKHPWGNKIYSIERIDRRGEFQPWELEAFPRMYRPHIGVNGSMQPGFLAEAATRTNNLAAPENKNGEVLMGSDQPEYDALYI